MISTPMFDHASLPSVSDARLPQSYEHAKTALAECSRIDECQSWADKAEAMASYAKQAGDDQLRRMADRIQARAIRRCGELLKQVEPGKNRYDDRREGTLPPNRTQAATDAGLSEYQRKTALRVASIPAPDFDAAVESDMPPTVTALADQGKKSRPLVDLKGRDPDEFNRALQFVGDVEYYARNCKKWDVEYMCRILVDSERERLRKAIEQIDAIHDQIITRI